MFRGRMFGIRGDRAELLAASDRCWSRENAAAELLRQSTGEHDDDTTRPAQVRHHRLDYKAGEDTTTTGETTRRRHDTTRPAQVRHHR